MGLNNFVQICKARAKNKSQKVTDSVQLAIFFNIDHKESRHCKLVPPNVEFITEETNVQAENANPSKSSLSPPFVAGKVSNNTSSNANVTYVNKKATTVPQLTSKKSRIFEDLPKLFESNAPEDLERIPESTSSVHTTPLILQEGKLKSMCLRMYI